ncbi:hypothetical protein ATF84_12128 [[Clostridium] innocuum]|nr:hypothetical protein ATF84_12128 [[Clostridium] innocuum]SSA48880.1 hypothetical protein SAMN04487929_12128 [[Clostridium] innocuum]
MIRFIQKVTEKLLFLIICVYIYSVDLSKLFNTSASQTILLRILLIITVIYSLIDFVLFLYYCFKKKEYIKHPISIFAKDIVSIIKKC